MKTKTIPFVFLSIVFGFAVAAVAQPRRLPGFGPADNADRLPGFGQLAGMPQATPQDQANAAGLIKKYDIDQDQSLSRIEVAQSKYKSYEEAWFKYDLDSDDRLTDGELGHWYAQVRVDQQVQAQKEARAKQRAAGATVTKDDKSNAVQLLANIDSNRDRKLDKNEMAAVWGRNVSNLMGEYDLNGSGFLSSNELSRHLAIQRAQQEQQQQQQEQQQQQQQRMLRMTLSNFSADQIMIFSEIAEKQPPVLEAAAELIQRYDKNGNGILESPERQLMEGSVEAADLDRDTMVTAHELLAWLNRPPEGVVPKRPVPAADWFAGRDANADGQVSMSEYAAQWTATAAEEFARYDHDDDGFIHPAESFVQQVARSGREYVSQESAVVEAGVGVYSTINVPDQFEIADLDVRISLSHRQLAGLDVELISPSGERIELFSGDGTSWKSPHACRFRLSDEANRSMTDASPPFRGDYAPEAVSDDEKPSLEHFYGEPSKGVWRLFIKATRTSRAGLLNHWSLVMVPQAPQEDS